MRAYDNLGGRMVSHTNKEDVASAVIDLSDCSVIVDALLGTGMTGNVRGAMRVAIESWPAVRTVAVDLPSGMNADTGEVRGGCVQAEVTVTFQFAKQGFENPGAKQYVGRLLVADIGIPACCAEGL